MPARGVLHGAPPSFFLLCLEHALERTASPAACLDPLAVPRTDVLRRRVRPAGSSLRVVDIPGHHGGRLAIDPLVSVAAMIDALLEARLAQRLVGELRPAFADPQQLVPGRAEPARVPLRARQLENRPGAQAPRPHLPGCHEEVRVMMTLVAPCARLVYREVDGAPVPVGQLPGTSSRKLRAVGLSKLRRERHQHFPGTPCVTALSGLLYCVPECGSLARPVDVRPARELRRQQDFLMRDVLTVGVVVTLARAIVVDPLAGAVGGSSRDATAFSPGEDFDVQEVLGHRALLPALRLLSACSRKRTESSTARASSRGSRRRATCSAGGERRSRSPRRSCALARDAP